MWRTSTWDDDHTFVAGEKPEFCVFLPEEALEYGTDDLRIDLYDAGWQSKPLVFRPAGADEAWPSGHVLRSGGDGRGTPTVTYRIEDWRERVQPIDSVGKKAVQEFDDFYQTQAAMSFEGPSDGRFPGEFIQPAAAVLVGTVEVVGLEEGRPPPPDQREVRAQLGASLLLSPKRADHGDFDAWH